MITTVNKKILIGLLCLLAVGQCILYFSGILDQTTFIALILGSLLFITLNISQARSETKGLIKKLMNESEKLLENSEMRAAKRNFQIILQARPRNSEALIGLGRAYTGMLQPAEAEKSFRKVMQLDPDDYRPYLLIGIARYRACKPLEARDMLTKAMELKRDVPEIYYYLGHIYDSFKDNSEAIEYYETYLLLRPDSPHKEEIKEKIKKLQTG